MLLFDICNLLMLFPRYMLPMIFPCYMLLMLFPCYLLFISSNAIPLLLTITLPLTTTSWYSQCYSPPITFLFNLSPFNLWWQQIYSDGSIIKINYLLSEIYYWHRFIKYNLIWYMYPLCSSKTLVYWNTHLSIY